MIGCRNILNFIKNYTTLFFTNNFMSLLEFLRISRESYGISNEFFILWEFQRIALKYLTRGVVMLLEVEGPKLPKLYCAILIWKSGGAQPYFYYSLSQKLGVGGLPAHSKTTPLSSTPCSKLWVYLWIVFTCLFTSKLLTYAFLQ